MVRLSCEVEEWNNIKAAGLLKLILNEKFVGTLLTMCDILPSFYLSTGYRRHFKHIYCVWIL